MKSLDANRYATKKTIAQGMLDIALLTANASQLKYILQVISIPTYLLHGMEVSNESLTAGIISLRSYVWKS